MIDYIQGEKFISLHDGVRVFYRHTHDVNNFFCNEAKNIKRKFILISHNSDGNIIDYHATLQPKSSDAIANLMPENLEHWYGQNVNCKHPKIESIPIGLENSQWFPETRKIEKLHLKLAEERTVKNLLYINHNVVTNPVERLEPYQLFGNRSWCTSVMGKNGAGFDDYIDNIYNHSFVICPDGNGIDTHRLWECAYLGTIPIVKLGINTSHYADLPICLVQNWHEINEAFLNDIYQKIKTRPFNLEKLTFNFWKNHITYLAKSLS